jgi:hypothetical protein
MSVELLHRRAWAITEPVLRRQESAAARTYRMLRGTGRTLDNLVEVLTAARQGRLDTLFVCADAPWWQAHTDAGTLLRLGGTPTPGEQLDLAAIATLRHAGAVFAVPAPRMPDATPVAATLRY